MMHHKYFQQEQISGFKSEHEIMSYVKRGRTL